MKKFPKILLFLILAVFLVAGSAYALPWVYSPYSPAGGTLAFGKTVVVGAQDINANEDGSQAVGIYGAGFTTGAHGIWFDCDVYTWDSYSITGDPSNNFGDKGWWDVFIVNINQTGYYWDLVSGGSGSINDPLVSYSYQGGYGIFNSVLPGATAAFGGEDYGNGTLESESWDPTGPIYLAMTGGDPTLPYYVSIVLDTKTPDYVDTSYPSWGSFHVQPVPEPATMLLLGSGLIGLAAFGRKKFFKK